MTRPLDLHITALGEVTPVGLTAAASCAALRAGISNKQEIYSRYLHPKTEWLALSEADVSQLLEIVARNWRKTQGVK